MNSILSADFPSSDKAAWLAQVGKELKDANAVESLRWHTDEGFVVDPYYTAEDRPPVEYDQAVQKQTPGWLNAPAYTLTNDAQADNTILRDTLTRGANALILELQDQVGSSAVQRLSRLLNGIKLSDTPVFFRLTGDVTTVVTALKTVAPYQLKGGLLTSTSAGIADVTRLTADSPQFRTVCSSGHAFHNAGATATQELAFVLASLADSYDTLTEAGLTIDQLIPKTILSVSTGTSYFMEIAKLRTLRVLFSRFVSHYPLASGSDESLLRPFVHCQTSAFYDAATTPYTNLLRATTEAMAAIVGGCDMLTVRPYDAVLGQTATDNNREFPDRIARNISVLLKEESYFDKVADPSSGSYYIENMTVQLTETAWSLFLEVEQRGGFGKAVESGFVGDAIDRSYQAKLEAVRQGRVLVGVNRFRHDDPTGQAYLSSADSTGILPNRRLSEAFE